MKVEVEGLFHDFCGACPHLSLMKKPDGWMSEGNGLFRYSNNPLSCENYDLCDRLWAELQKRITGSVVEEDEL